MAKAIQVALVDGSYNPFFALSLNEALVLVERKSEEAQDGYGWVGFLCREFTESCSFADQLRNAGLQVHLDKEDLRVNARIRPGSRVSFFARYCRREKKLLCGRRYT